MAYRTTITPLGTDSIASSALTGTYLAINSSPLPNNVYILRIYNAGSTDITITYDGVTDQDVVPAATLFEIQGFPIGSNTQGAMLPALLTVSAKGTAGTGNIYISAYTLSA